MSYLDEINPFLLQEPLIPLPQYLNSLLAEQWDDPLLLSRIGELPDELQVAIWQSLLSSSATRPELRQAVAKYLRLLPESHRATLREGARGVTKRLGAPAPGAYEEILPWPLGAQIEDSILSERLTKRGCYLFGQREPLQCTTMAGSAIFIYEFGNGEIRFTHPDGIDADSLAWSCPCVDVYYFQRLNPALVEGLPYGADVTYRWEDLRNYTSPSGSFTFADLANAAVADYLSPVSEEEVIDLMQTFPDVRPFPVVAGVTPHWALAASHHRLTLTLGIPQEELQLQVSMFFHQPGYQSPRFWVETTASVTAPRRVLRRQGILA